MKTKKINRPGERIYQQMVEAGLTVRDLAFLLGKTYTVVYYTVRGRANRRITLDFAQKCAVIFDQDPAVYLELQVEHDLCNHPIDAEFKKQLQNRIKELVFLKKTKNKRHAGRKWIQS